MHNHQLAINHNHQLAISHNHQLAINHNIQAKDTTIRPDLRLSQLFLMIYIKDIVMTGRKARNHWSNFQQDIQVFVYISIEKKSSSGLQILFITFDMIMYVETDYIISLFLEDL